MESPNPRGATSVSVVALLAAYVTILFAGTHVPEADLPFALRFESLLHFVAYGMLTGLILGAMSVWNRRLPDRPISRGRWYLPGLFLCVAVIAYVDELTQPFTGRGFEWRDWCFDLAGSFVVVLLAATWRFAGRDNRPAAFASRTSS